MRRAWRVRMDERIRGARDVVLFLKEQHEQIEMGSVQILTSSG
jgi:hypothetical protein